MSLSLHFEKLGEDSSSHCFLAESWLWFLAVLLQWLSKARCGGVKIGTTCRRKHAGLVMGRLS